MGGREDYYDELEPTILDSSENENSSAELFGEEEEEETRVVKRKTPAFAWIVCTDRHFNGEKFDIKDGVTSIGRSSHNDIVIGDDSVSLEHAKIKYFKDKDIYKIYDLVSTNGTFVNDVRVEAPVELKDGDVVTIGEIDFIFKRVKIRKLKRRRVSNE